MDIGSGVALVFLIIKQDHTEHHMDRYNRSPILFGHSQHCKYVTLESCLAHSDSKFQDTY